jgi:hypothetical protein
MKRNEDQQEGWVSCSYDVFFRVEHNCKSIIAGLIADGLIECDGECRRGVKSFWYRLTDKGSVYCRQLNLKSPEILSIRKRLKKAWLVWATKNKIEMSIPDQCAEPCHQSGQMTATRWLRDEEFGRMIRELLIDRPEEWNPCADTTKMTEEQRDQWRYWYRLEQALFAITNAWNENGVSQSTDGRRYYNPLVYLPKVIRRQYMPQHWEVDVRTSHIQLLAYAIISGDAEKALVLGPAGEMISPVAYMSGKAREQVMSSARKLSEWTKQNDFYGAIAARVGVSRDQMKQPVQCLLGYKTKNLLRATGLVGEAKKFMQSEFPGIIDLIVCFNRYDNASLHLFLMEQEKRLMDRVYQSVLANEVSDCVMRLHDGFIVFGPDGEVTARLMIDGLSSLGILPSLSPVGYIPSYSDKQKYPPKYPTKYVPESVPGVSESVPSHPSDCSLYIVKQKYVPNCVPSTPNPMSDIPVDNTPVIDAPNYVPNCVPSTQEPTQTTQAKEIPQMTYTTTETQDDLRPTQDDIEPPTTIPVATIAQEPEVETITIIRTENHNIKGVTEEEQKRINDLLADW